MATETKEAASAPLDAHNAEFVRLLAKSRWLPAEAARRLAVSPGTISQYRSGETRPSLTVLRLFACLIREPLTLATEEAESVEGGDSSLEPDESALLAELRRYQPAERRELLAAIRLILKSKPQTKSQPQALQRSAADVAASAPAPSAGSDVESLSDDATRKTFVSAIAAAGGRRAVELIEQKRKAASPSGSKDAPAPTAPAKKGAPQSSPTRARK